MKIVEMKNKNNEKVLPSFIEQEISNSKLNVPSSYAVNILKNKNYQILEAGTNIDELKEQWDNRMYAIFGATGTLPSGYTTDNNIFIQTIMWASDYGRQILYDIRTIRIFTRNLSAGVWKDWEVMSDYYEDVSDLIVPTSLTGTIYRKIAIKKGKHITLDIKCDVSNYGIIFNIDNSIFPIVETSCIGCNYSASVMESSFIEAGVGGTIYFSRNGELQPYLLFHLEWDIN